MYLRNELHGCKCNGISINNFVDKITNKADSFALVGKPVGDVELVSIIMNYVRASYEATVTVVGGMG